MECPVTCIIRKNGETVKELKQNALFTGGKLTGYGDVLKKLQAEVNQSLTDIVEQENATNADKRPNLRKKNRDQGDVEDDEDDDNDDIDNSGDGGRVKKEKSPEIPRSPKHKITGSLDASKRKHKKS